MAAARDWLIDTELMRVVAASDQSLPETKIFQEEPPTQGYEHDVTFLKGKKKTPSELMPRVHRVSRPERSISMAMSNQPR